METERREKENLEKFIQHGFKMFSSTLDKIMDSKEELRTTWQCSVVGDFAGGVVGVCVATGLAHLSLGGASQVALAAAKKGKSLAEMPFLYDAAEQYENQRNNILTWTLSKDGNETQFLRTVAEGLGYICVAYKDQIQMFHNTPVNNNIFFRDVFRRIFNYMKNNSRNLDTPLNPKEFYNTFINGRSTPQGFKKQMQDFNTKKVRGLEIEAKENAPPLNTETLFEGVGHIKCDSETNKDFKLKVNEVAPGNWRNTDFRLQYDFEKEILDERKRLSVPQTILERNVIEDHFKSDWRLNKENVRSFVENISRKVNTKKELGKKWWVKPDPLPKTFYERKPDTKAFLKKMKNILDVKNKVVVSGFVGVGKTAITKRFAQEWENSYEHVIWIDCTGEGLKKSFSSLAEKLKIESCDKMKMSQVAAHCFNVLKDFLCLWIFDDAKGFNCEGGIKDILPESNKNFHLVITSRNKEWGTESGLGQIENIQMTTFTDEEAFEFMSSNMGEIKVHEQKMRFLINLLGNLPLALQIALKYLTQKRKTLSDFIEMIKEKAGIIEENFDDYRETIKDSMKMYLKAIDPTKEAKEKLGHDMLLYFGYITSNDVNIDFFRSVVDEKVIHGADLLEQYSLVTKTVHSSDGATRNLTTNKEHFSIHQLMQLVIRHSTEIERKNAVIQKILNCENFTHYKLLPYFMSDSETQNSFATVKSAIIHDMDLKELFLKKKLMEAEILSRLIYYDASPPTKLATYNYALCLQHNQDSDDAIVIFENLYDNIIEIYGVNNSNFQPSVPSDRHQYYFGVLSSQESDPNIEILAGQLFVLYFNNNNNKHEADKKISTLIQNTAVIFQCKSNIVVEVLEFLVHIIHISNFSFKYDGQKANALLQSNNIGKKFDLSNCYINENIILVEMETHCKLQELELTKVMTSPNFFAVFKQPIIPKLTFRNMVVDMRNDLTAEEINLEKVTVLAWNQAKWNTNKLTLQNVDFIEQTDIIVNELTILNSTVNGSILPKSITSLILNGCRVQPVVSFSPLAIKLSCPRLQECTFNSVTFQDEQGEDLADFDISYSIRSHFLCLKKLTLDCSTQECTNLCVSVECLSSIMCLNLNACDLILVSSKCISPKELTLTNVKLFKNFKENDENHILVNDFVDFHQMQKLNLEGMPMYLVSGCVSESDAHQNSSFLEKIKELDLKDVKFTDKDGNELEKLDITPSKFNSLNKLTLQGHKSVVYLQEVVHIQSIHLNNCGLIIPTDWSQNLTRIKPKPISLELINVSFFDGTEKTLLNDILVNDLFDFSKIQKLKLDGAISIDLSEELEVDEVCLKSVKVLDWKTAKWRIRKLILENVSKYEESQIWAQETMIDGESYLCKAFCRKLGEGQRNAPGEIALEDFTVSAMGAFRIKKILQNYAELEQKWQSVLPKTLGLSKEMQGQLDFHQGGFGSLIFKTLKFWRISKGEEAKFNGFVEVIRNHAEHNLAADQLLKNKESIRFADMIDANRPISSQNTKNKGVGNEVNKTMNKDDNSVTKTCKDSGKEVQVNKKLQECGMEIMILQSNLKVLKSKDDIKRWLKMLAVDIKILLKTTSTLPMQIVSRFKEFSSQLSMKDIHTAITLPNVDNVPCLIVKTKSREEFYFVDSILFLMDVLLVAFDCSSDLSQLQRTFYHLAACLKTEKLPLCKNSDEVCQLIEALRPLQKIKFRSTCVQTMSHLIVKDDKWKVVVTLDAEISAYEATKKMLFLSKYYEKVFGEFLVGSFGIKYEHDAPLAFIFRNGKLEAVILDNLDMRILDILSKDGESIELSVFSLLSPSQVVENSLYSKKASYTSSVMSLFGTPSNNECNSDICKVFPPAHHEFFQKAMGIVQGYLQSNKNSIISGMGNICQVYESKFQPIISKHNARIDTELENYDSYDEYAEELEQIYRKTNILIVKLMDTLDYLNSVDLDGEECEKLLNEIINDNQWPEDIKKVLSGCYDMHLSAKIENVTLFLKNCFHKNVNEKKQNCQIAFLECLKIVRTDKFSIAEIKEKLLHFLHYAADQSAASTDIEKAKQLKFISTIRENNFYKLAKVIASTQENDKLFSLKQELEKLSKYSAMRIINIIADNEFNEGQSQVVWNNPKLCFLFEQEMSNKDFIPTIYHKLCKQKIPAYLPNSIVDEIKLQYQEIDVEMPSEISTFNDMRTFFQNIVQSGHLPENFREFLRKNLEINVQLQTEMKECDALPFWNGKYFTDVWRISTVDESLKRMNNYYMDTIKRLENKNKKKRPPTLQFHPQPKEIVTEEIEILKLQVLDEWVPLVGSVLNYVKPENFLNLRPLKNNSDVKLFEEDVPIKHLLSFFLQRLKTWGTTVLHPQNLNNFMPTPVVEVRTKSSNSNTGAMTALQRMELRKQEKAVMNEIGKGAPSEQSSSKALSVPLSRIDILTIIIQCCSSTIVDDLLRIISQFPMSLPLIVPSVTKKDEFHFLYPLLQSVHFKWETGLKKVKHNSLFTTSFRMIVTVRLGEAKSGKPGKSTIINQLFHTPFIFSSLQEPGASRGKPVSLPGLVEFVVLSQDTCKESLWQSAIAQHYQTQAEDVLLLANVHGDAVFYSDTIRLLKKLNCEFIVFLMAQDCEKAGEKLAAFEEIIGKGVEESSVLVVDSSPADIGDFYDETNKIDTSQLTDDSTLRKVRQVLKDALDKQGVCRTMPNIPPNIGNIFLAEQIVTKQSQELIDFATKKTCRRIKNTFKLQKTKNFDISMCHNDRNLQNLINMFANILILPLNLRRMGVHHLDREISRLSSDESAQCRENILMLKEQFRSTIDLRDQQFELQAIKNKLNQDYAKLDTTSLGLEHFFRELGRVYEFAEYTSDSTVTKDNSVLLCMPKMCAELLVDGTAIEILDGDISHINSSWFTCVCKHIHLKYPNLNIFVISVLGLQSSGKSTLLNVLFGCKFAVSAGRCTRGLFMRLIFLDESLVKELGIDAVILIDTEGLGAPEKMNEANAERNDRLMATFAMSISNLTIINVLGEAYRSLTEILQIVIITMARLDKAEMSPDVLMVQHVSERDESKLMLGADKFCEALQEAIVMVSKESMKLGANECKSLKTLVARVRKGELLKIFRAFKSGATLNAPPSQEYLDDANSLYADILKAAKNSGKSTLFKKWYSLLPVYWEEISAENFALNFKNIKDVQDFIDRDQSISQMKQAIYLAFQHHRDILEKQCRAKTNEELKNNSSFKWNQIKDKLFKDAEIDMKSVPQTCKSCNNFPCEACNDAVMKMKMFFKQVDNQYYKVEITSTIHKYISNVRSSMMTELKQMVKATEVKLEKFTEFETIINGILQNKLAKKSHYSDTERRGIVEEIWSTLVSTVSDENKIASVEERIKDQVKKVYTNNLNMEIAFQNPYYEPLDTLTTKPWYSVETTCLSFELANKIQSYLEKLPFLILKENNEEKFEDWMVKRLYDEIQKYSNGLKKQCPGGLSAELKVKIHQNGIRIFTLVMSNMEYIWRNNNDPLVILKNKENDYKDIINVRLQYGFDIDGEGRLMADAVLKAIKKLSQNTAERKQCDLVLSQLWITNSENVRLKYFTMLATQVDKGSKTEAMAFFRRPKNSIEDWFTKEVNSFSSDSVLKEYTIVSQNEYNKMKTQIELFETCVEIEECILSYIRQVEGVDYKCRMTFDTYSDAESLKRIIISSLISGRGDLTKNIEIQGASMQEIVMNRLGCTENCPACGSLCWGERGHDQNADNTNKHHSTHQPTGLVASHDYDSLELICRSCDKREEDLNVYVNGRNQPPLLWKNVKQLPEYINWGFGPHFKTRFSKLMKWFLFQLHEDIAEKYNYKPIRPEDLQQGGFTFIELPQIMAEMKSQI